MPGLLGNERKLLGISTRRPAVAVAILFSLGILSHDHLPLQPGGLLIAIACFAIFTVAALRLNYISTASLAALILLLGTAVARREHEQFAPNDIGLFATDEAHLTQLQLQLIDDPQLITGPPDQRALPPKQITTASVLKIKTQTGWISATGRLPLQIDQPQPALRAGQIVEALGMLQRPRAAMNPGEFDWAAYYRQQRILANFTVNRAGNVRILSDPGPGWLTWLRDKSHHLLASGFTNAHGTDYAMLDALVLGNRDPQLRYIQQEFQQTGVGYQLNVSGMHIALLAWVVLWICRSACLRPRASLLITTAFVLLYAAISLPSHSGIRWAILCVVFTIAALSGRFTDSKHLLAIAVIAMLLWHPMDIDSVGFQLSFAVCIAFVILLPALQSYLRSREHVDESAKPKDPNPSLFTRLFTRVKLFLQFDIIAWVATLPLIAYHFGQTSIWSIPANLILFPLIVAALFSGVLKILLTLLWPSCAATFATATHWPPHAILWIVHRLSTIPHGALSLSPPSIWLIIVYYLLLLAPLLPHWRWVTGRRRWALRVMPLLGITLIFGSQLLPQPASQAPGELRMTLLSLGAGQCAVVELPNRHTILIDAGSTTVSDVAQKIVEPFLRADGDETVDDIFLSHGDFDHISAAGEITSQFEVKQVFTSFHFKKNAAGNIPDLLLLDELDRLNRSPHEISLGDHFDLGDGAAIDCLWSPKVADLNSNNAGLVLRLTYAGKSILFPADIQDPAFTGVLKNPAALKSDILIAPHHGSSEDLTPAFLAAVHPQTILSSNFWRLTSKQKRFETMIGHTPLYRTPECGAITVVIGKDGTIKVGTFVNGVKPK